MSVFQSQLESLRVTQENQPTPALRYPTPIDVVQVQTTATTVFTAPDDTDFHVESLIASNVTGGAAYVTIYLVPDGGSAGATNLAIYQKAVPANDWVSVFDKNNMGLVQPGMSIQALCGTNDDINIFGHGFEYKGEYGR